MRNTLATVGHEFKKMLPPTIYFFFMLVTISVVRALMLRGSGISLPVSASIFVASLILGKAVMLANMLPFINRYPDRPLMWNAGWKTLIYTAVAMFLHYLERLLDFWKGVHNVAAANRELLAHMNWPHFWAIQILLLVLIANYCVLAEIGRALGKGELKAMFFKRPWVVPHADFERHTM
jgi:hypothetical protein